MKLLITGGAGFIGSNLVTYLVKKYPRYWLTIFDNFSHGSDIENLEEFLAAKQPIDPMSLDYAKYLIFDRDIRGLTNDWQGLIFDPYSYDIVLHLAALTHVDASICDPKEFTDNNCLGTQAVLDFCVKYKKPLIYYSTDEVYGSCLPYHPTRTGGYMGQPFTEEAPLSPMNPYSVSKAFGDMLVQAYHNTYDIRYMIVRPANCYGPRQHQEKFIPTIIRSVLDGKPVPVYGDGMQERMWVYVEDHCEAVDLLIHKGQWNQVYNIGTDFLLDNGTVARTVAKLTAEKTGLDYRIQSVKDRPGHDRKYWITWDKLKGAVGWEPRTAWELGLQRTVNWYLAKWGK